jgi:uncharacterized membrane protein YkoI
MKIRKVYQVSLLAVGLAACGGLIQPEPAREVVLRAALDEAEVSLPEALGCAGAAEGDIVGAELEVEDGKATYLVEVETAGGTVQVEIDPATCQVLGVEDAEDDENGDEDGEGEHEGRGGHEDAAPCTGAQLSLDRGISAAEGAVAGGRAVTAENDGCGVTVEVLADDGIYEVTVSADGTVKKIEAPEKEDDDEEEDDDD